MFCPYCGKKDVQNLDKCPECGKSIKGIVETVEDKPVRKRYHWPQKKKLLSQGLNLAHCSPLVNSLLMLMDEVDV